jgi:tetratricopeptide (TPR) repeat protein
LKRDEKLYEAWAAIGIIYYLTNQPQRAINSFTNAIQNAPKKFSDLYSKRAACFLLLDKWNEAFQDASIAIDINSEELHAYLIKGKKNKFQFFFLFIIFYK